MEINQPVGSFDINTVRVHTVGRRQSCEHLSHFSQLAVQAKKRSDLNYADVLQKQNNKKHQRWWRGRRGCRAGAGGGRE